jgi:hypothetical protein
MHVRPPQLLIQIGPMIVEPGDGVHKSVKRFGITGRFRPLGSGSTAGSSGQGP